MGYLLLQRLYIYTYVCVYTGKCHITLRFTCFPDQLLLLAKAHSSEPQLALVKCKASHDCKLQRRHNNTMTVA
jgi:hypothetical protein